MNKSPHEREIRDLEPHMLRRQLRALELTAARLSDERPAPAPAFVARIGELDASDYDRPRPSGAVRWGLGTAVCLGLGLALLVVAALMVAAGASAGTDRPSVGSLAGCRCPESSSVRRRRRPRDCARRTRSSLTPSTRAISGGARSAP